MTASVKIAGTVPAVPDNVSAPVLDSGASIKSNFRSVLEQFHTSRESASEKDEAPRAVQQKQKDSDPTTPAITQPGTPAVEAPRLILPFTTSITLQEDTSVLPDDTTATQDATTSQDGLAAQDATAGADSNALSTAIATTLPTPVVLGSALDVRNLLRAGDTKMNSGAGGTQPKKHSNLQASLTDSSASQPAAAVAQAVPADPSVLILPVTPSTSEQAITVVQNSSTVSEPPNTVSGSTSDRTIAYQYRSSNERSAETTGTSRSSQGPQQVSDPTPGSSGAATVQVAVPNTVQPQPLLHSPTGSNVPRQAANVNDSGSAVPQDSSATSGNDSKTAMPPALEDASETTAAPNTGALAFAARLTSTGQSQPPPSETAGPAEPLPGSQTSMNLATSVTAKQAVTGTDLPADAHGGEGGGQPDKEKGSDLFAKPDTLLPQMHVAVADQGAIPANHHGSSAPLSPTAHMDKTLDAPAAAPKTNNDITVRIPDSTDQGTAVRFVERAGEIHVSVRTGDAEVAQSLRGGLNDLVNHLEDGGIRTEVWQPGPGSNAAFSQNDSHQPFSDPDGSNGRQTSSDSNSEQESKQPNKPRWVEELEGSIGNPNFKETTQILWQA
jgi:hypothetical protein